MTVLKGATLVLLNCNIFNAEQYLLFDDNYILRLT